MEYVRSAIEFIVIWPLFTSLFGAWNFSRPHWPVIAAGDTPDFGRAAYNYFAASAAILATRAHEGMATAASAGLGVPTTPATSAYETDLNALSP